MGKQTDGIEWVMATLFVIALVIVVGAAIREIRKVRQGDLGGDESPPPRRKIDSREA